MNDLVASTRAHIHHYLLESFVNALKTIHDVPLKNILTKLCHLFALRTIQQNIGDFVEDGYLSNAQIVLVKKAVTRLCKEIRPFAVSLTDAFNIPDFILNSPLGRKDGDIYDKYLEAVKGSRYGFQKTPYWDDLVKPHVENQSQSKYSCCGGFDCKKDGCNTGQTACSNTGQCNKNEQGDCCPGQTNKKGCNETSNCCHR